MHTDRIFLIAIYLLVNILLSVTSEDVTFDPYFPSFQTPTNLSGTKKFRRNAVIFLVPAFGQAIDGLPCSLPCSTVDKDFLIAQFLKIDEAMMDNFETDVIIFHEGYPEYEDLVDIRNSTKRSVDFVNIDAIFLRIPPKLNPYDDQPTWSKRAKWRYQQMIRFMVTDIFQFPVMDNVDYFMRLDIDSCFRNSFSNLFSYMNGPGRRGIVKDINFLLYFVKRSVLTF